MNNEGNLVHNRIRLDRFLFRVSSCGGDSRSLLFDVLIFKDRKGFVIWQSNMALVCISLFFVIKNNFKLFNADLQQKVSKTPFTSRHDNCQYITQPQYLGTKKV